ncbi:MAG TPA: alanine racemase [Nocardioidaceae bacterium]|nr:alanine racemase [Nocardioidaceae bacterium]
MSNDQPRGEIVVDLDAIRHNVRRLREVAAPAAMLAVVKADGYGHGMVPVARAARDAGADWIGVAVLEEAMALRATGDRGRLLCWLAVPGESYEAAIEADIDLTASSTWQLDEIVAAARRVGEPARLQLKADTGLCRNGATMEQWSTLVMGAATAQAAGVAVVTGVWSHFACADEPDHPSVKIQEDAFVEALAVAAGAGLEPEVRHLANSPATLTRASSHFDLVRCGIAMYGLTPVPQVASSADLGLRPAMTVRSRLAAVKRVPAGSGVSYGHTHLTDRETTLGLVPLGYADGIPRHASNQAEVAVGGRRYPIAGRVCMDQFVVDLGDSEAWPGESVELFGAGDDGMPTAQDWADAAGTISYDIVTGVRGRAIRRWTGADL